MNVLIDRLLSTLLSLSLSLARLLIHRHPHNNNSPLRDVVSGVIMAATSVPQLIAYAETTGYAGYRGLTTAGPPYVKHHQSSG
jgi:hypothetical protein